MDTTKVYIDDQQDTADIQCPSCQKITEVSIAALGFKHHLKVKCVCDSVFMVEVEFRDKSRKRVDLPGFYEIGEDQQETKKTRADIHWEDTLFPYKEPNCLIIDLSKGGIGFIMLNDRDVKVGDFVELGFRLDNKAQNKITQPCQVKHVNGNFVGCSMLKENVTLGFYLLGN